MRLFVYLLNNNNFNDYKKRLYLISESDVNKMFIELTFTTLRSLL